MRSIFSSYILIVILTILIILIGSALSNNLSILDQKSSEQKNLEKNLARIEKQNQETLNRINSLKDQDVIEQELRKRFNLKIKGEEVVIIHSPEDGDERKPLTDQDFLNLYYSSQQKEEISQNNNKDESFLDKARSVLEKVLGGREIHSQEG